MVEKTFTVTDTLGIHARPASSLVRTANEFQSQVNLLYKEKVVNLKSIISIMSLGIKQGDAITFQISGNDESKAIERIHDVIQNEKIGE